MKHVFFAIGLLASIHGMAQQAKTTTARTSKESKSYDKVPKAVPLAFSWSNTELGFSIGSMTYWGDLQSQNITWSQSKIGGGLMLRNSLHPNLAVRASINFGTIQASDAEAKDLDRVRRNLSFRSRILEYGVSGEFLLPIRRKVGGDDKTSTSSRFAPIVPYAVAGLHLFHFNPQAEYKGTWYDLKPLNTEGQNLNRPKAKDYHLTQVSLPLGVGVKFQLSQLTNIAIELGARKTFTDYLDDVSTSYPDLAAQQLANGDLGYKLSWRGNEIDGRETKVVPEGTRRGNADNNDWYFMSTMSLRIKLGK